MRLMANNFHCDVIQHTSNKAKRRTIYATKNAPNNQILQVVEDSNHNSSGGIPSASNPGSNIGGSIGHRDTSCTRLVSCLRSYAKYAHPLINRHAK